MSETGAWHPDPVGQASWRWWDGSRWTDQIGPARPTPELAAIDTALGRSAVLVQEWGSGTDALECEGSAIGLMHKPAVGDVTAETTTGTWTFDRQGIVHSGARILVQPAQAEVARFDWDGVGSGSDGTLRFPDGRWLRLARATQLAAEGVTPPADYDPSHSVWVWYGPDRAPVLTLRLAARKQTKKIFGREIEYTSSGTGKTGNDVWTDFHPAAAGIRELGLVTMLGTYLIWFHTTMRESVRRDARIF